MANRPYGRQSYVRTRSPTPPWLQDWPARTEHRPRSPRYDYPHPTDRYELPDRYPRPEGYLDRYPSEYPPLDFALDRYHSELDREPRDWYRSEAGLRALDRYEDRYLPDVTARRVVKYEDSYLPEVPDRYRSESGRKPRALDRDEDGCRSQSTKRYRPYSDKSPKHNQRGKKGSKNNASKQSAVGPLSSLEAYGPWSDAAKTAARPRNSEPSIKNVVSGNSSAQKSGNLLGTDLSGLPFNDSKPLKKEQQPSSSADPPPSSDDFISDDPNTLGVQFTGVVPKALEKKMVSRGRGLYCALCDVGVTDIERYQRHLLGAKHKKTLKLKGLDDEIGTPSQAVLNTATPGTAGLGDAGTKNTGNGKVMFCIVCRKECQFDKLGPHVTEEEHTAAEEKWKLLNKKLPRFIDMFVQIETGSSAQAGTKSIPFCEICNITLSSFEELQIHIAGKKHAKMVAKQSGTLKDSYHCEVCDIHCTSEGSIMDHYKGKKHATKLLEAKNAAHKPSNTPAARTTSTSAIYTCDVCNVHFTSADEFKLHFTRIEHFLNVSKRAKTGSY